GRGHDQKRRSWKYLVAGKQGPLSMGNGGWDRDRRAHRTDLRGTRRCIGGAYGAAAGGGGGAIMGMLGSDFFGSVTSELHPGMTAVIVEADEKSTRPVDDIVARGGGHVYRQAA